MKVKEYVENLSFDEKLEIIADLHKFEKEGVIGDCLLRRTARKIIDDLNIDQGVVTIWMLEVANHTFRIIAEKALEQGVVKEWYR